MRTKYTLILITLYTAEIITQFMIPVFFNTHYWRKSVIYLRTQATIPVFYFGKRNRHTGTVHRSF